MNLKLAVINRTNLGTNNTSNTDDHHNIKSITIKEEYNQTENNTKNERMIKEKAPFHYNNYQNESDYFNQNILFQRNGQEELKILGNMASIKNVSNTNPLSGNLIDKHSQSNNFRQSTSNINSNTSYDTNILYVQAKYKYVKKIFPDNSHRSRVNSVFESSSKMIYNYTKTNLDRFRRRGTISLLGLFELTTQNGKRDDGLSEMQAAKLAVKHINAKNILPGYQLELLINDTKCDPGVGIDRFFHALYTRHNTRIVMLLGSACSEVTETLAKIVPYWNVLQVSFGSTSPALSDRGQFPLFYRTSTPDSSHNRARIAFIRKFNWDTVTTFSQNEEVYSLAINDLVTELERANISCTATITFAETDFKEQIRLLKDLDTRIIIGSFSQKLAPIIFCEAYKLSMYGSDYAWMVQEDLGSSWWFQSTDECTVKQLQNVVENMIIVSSHNSIVGQKLSYSGLSNTMFQQELQGLNVSKHISRYAAQTYDAVWAISLALRKAEAFWRNRNLEQFKLDSFDYTRYDMAMEFLYQFSQLKFLGVSGPVSFDGADRIGNTALYQIQSSKVVQISLYYPETQYLDFACINCSSIKWYKGQTPIAKRILKFRIVTISPVAFYTITAFSCIGVLLSALFLSFNLYFRKIKAIKISSPKLSNITALGCILVYMSVIFLGLDHSTLPAYWLFPAVCIARVSLLSSGFSLAFGSMFAKTYRVHRILCGGGLCKDRILQDSKLILLICILLLIDGFVVLLWILKDPMERYLSNLNLEISTEDRSVVYQPQVEVCQSQHTSKWLGILYIYKGLLLVVGVYMAWETRHVKISALNDSQYIGISVYSVVITSASVVVLANLLAERVTLSFIIISVFILISTTATLCLLFLPKIRDIWRKDNRDLVVHSMGLKIECNTRRFVMDDNREVYYRVEVQNRVYKREIAALDAEIQKLERLILEPHISSTSSSTITIQTSKMEVCKVSEHIDLEKPEYGTLTSGLPLLLLSVLPSVPRASWPSAEHMSVPMRRSVTFNSEPRMDEETCRLPSFDLINLGLKHQRCMENKSILDKLKGIFGSRVPSRKTSLASVNGQGITAAFKSHMNLLTGLVPAAHSTSCSTLNLPVVDPKVLRRPSFAKSGTSIEITEPEFVETRRMSSVTVIKTRDFSCLKTELNTSESKVNFLLPPNRRSSIFQLESKVPERIKGSPRYPHKIMPTSSLSSLGEQRISKEKKSNTALDASTNNERRSRPPFKARWKSMDDSTCTTNSFVRKNTQIRRVLPTSPTILDK
ncbi:gamma-aminobutyric acid type B receptor subunit 2 [Culicoides brevitarsis]|uniref:gamma-aminobutyric acid type B receptor subunit 2 n=1 Tax=Culicoides brevitarsis TaxID=469753 RepID=UPI00307CAD42